MNILRLSLHWMSTSMLWQRYGDASDTDLIEKNAVAPE